MKKVINESTTTTIDGHKRLRARTANPYLVTTSLKIDRRAMKKLKFLALHLEVTAGELMVEAIEDLFKKKGSVLKKSLDTKGLA